LIGTDKLYVSLILNEEDRGATLCFATNGSLIWNYVYDEDIYVQPNSISIFENGDIAAAIYEEYYIKHDGNTGNIEAYLNLDLV